MQAWQATVQDDRGNAVPNPVVTVYQENGTTISPIFNEGGTALPNPLTGTIDGFVQFFAGPGRRKIEVTGGPTWDVDFGPVFATNGQATTGTSTTLFMNPANTRAAIDGRIAPQVITINTRIDGVDDRIDGVDGDVSAVGVRIDGIDDRIDGVDSRIDGVDTDITTVNARITEAAGKPIVVYAAGQSNMRSTINQTGGDLSTNQNVFFWNSQASGQINGNQWVVANPGQNPFASQPELNNLAFQFAKQLQVRTGRRVYVVLVAIGGQGIEAFISPSDLTTNGWSRASSDEALDEFGLAQVNLAMPQVPGSPTQFDYFMWHQGEANRADQVELYARKMNVMLSRWESRGRVSRTGSQILAGEIIETATTAQTKERHANALKRMQINVASEAWPRFKVVPSFSLRPTGPSDLLHFAGADLDAFGGRYVDAAFTAQVPDDYNPLTCDKSVNAGLNWLISHTVSGSGAYLPTRFPFPLSSTPTTIENNSALGWAHVAPADTSISLVTRRTMIVPNQRNLRVTLQIRNDSSVSGTFQFAAHTFSTSGVFQASVGATPITISGNSTQVVSATIGRTSTDVTLASNVRWYAPRFIFNGGGTGASLKFLFLDVSLE